jgi:hypothetical protein
MKYPLFEIDAAGRSAFCVERAIYLCLTVRIDRQLSTRERLPQQRFSNFRIVCVEVGSLSSFSFLVIGKIIFAMFRRDQAEAVYVITAPGNRK